MGLNPVDRRDGFVLVLAVSFFCFWCECGPNDRINWTIDDNLNHVRGSVFNGCCCSFVDIDAVLVGCGDIDDESAKLGVEVDWVLVMTGSIIWIGWRSFFGRWWGVKWWMIFFRERWEVVVVFPSTDEFGREVRGTGISERNG